ncbi:MAG: OB-fold domain-containing protein [Deltaproteobacteria bacterium]|nr:OB-fold domain-containing protein [Deltaproteobacteria bacterium]
MTREVEWKSAEDEKLPIVMPGILDIPGDGGQPSLLGGSCPSCGVRYFPRPPRCRRCLGPVEESSVGAEGTVYSFTVIRTRAPLGLPEPYAIGYVDLKESGLRVFCLLDPQAVEEFRIGVPVRLAVGALGHNVHGSSCLRPYFMAPAPGPGGVA